MEKDMISVVIPTYNRAKTIKRAIDSVLNQTYSNIEIIIVDDSSTDNTSEIIGDYNNEKIKYHKLEKNSGACAARNIGIQMASGKYIAFQDSDDEWVKEKLEKQIKTLKKTNTKVTFCALNYMQDGKKTGKKIPDIDVNKFKNMTKELLKENFISTQTILGEKSVFDEIKFDEALPRFQDWDLAIRISKLYKISYLDEALVNLYIQKDSITKSPQKKVKAFEIMYKKYYKDINEDTEIKYCFEANIALAIFNAGELCTKELKASLKERFNIKIFICYIGCITKTNRLILKIKKLIKK